MGAQFAVGKHMLPLKFGTCHFSWSFHLAEVDRPILGANFLAANNLLGRGFSSSLIGRSFSASLSGFSDFRLHRN